MTRSSEGVVDLVEAELSRRFLPSLTGERTSWLDLVETIAREEGVDRRAVNSMSSRASVSRARHRVWLALRDARYSYPEIAMPWGANHTSVRAAVVKLRDARPEAA